MEAAWLGSEGYELVVGDNDISIAAASEPEDILACLEEFEKVVAAALIHRDELRIDARGDLKKIEEVQSVGQLLDPIAGVEQYEQLLCSARSNLKGTGKLIRCFAVCRPYYLCFVSPPPPIMKNDSRGPQIDIYVFHDIEHRYVILRAA